MRTLEANHQEALAAQTRGAMYGLFAWAFSYPDEQTRSTLASFVPRLQALSLERLDDETRSALDSVTAALDAPEIDENLNERYFKLFGHAVRGSCPLYELEYGQSEIIQQAGELADIAGFYAAFGMDKAGEGSERPDHLSVECEFMSVLCAKYAMGVLSGNAPLGEVCEDGQRTFLRDHLARWLPSLCSRVSKADGEGLYGRVARLAAGFVKSECRSLGITAGPEFLELRRVDPQVDAEIQCGPAGGDPLVPLTIGGSTLNGE